MKRDYPHSNNCHRSDEELEALQAEREEAGLPVTRIVAERRFREECETLDRLMGEFDSTPSED